MQALTPSVKASGALDIYNSLQEISGGKVLDVGTQSGDFLGTMLRSLKDYDSFIGIDIDDKHFESAKKRYLGRPVSFQVMDAENLEFQDAMFDTVSLSYTIHHLVHPIRVLQEMHRVLKPGGYLLLQEMFCDGNQTDSQRMDILIHHWGAQIDRHNNEPHFETLSRIQLRNLIGALEFDDIQVYEATCDIGCLFCEEMEKCENPKDDAIINPIIKDMDKQLEKMISHPDYQKISEEAQILKQKLRIHGSSAASTLFFICRK